MAGVSGWPCRSLSFAFAETRFIAGRRKFRRTRDLQGIHPAPDVDVVDGRQLGRWPTEPFYRGCPVGHGLAQSLGLAPQVLMENRPAQDDRFASCSRS